jgi:hypothetical protein
MHRVIRWFLYTVIVLVVVIWIGLGLLRPEYLKRPFVAWVQQQTGLPFDIGKLNYNPLYPNVVLAENVTLGPDIRVDKLYLEIAGGSWWKRDLHIAHLDIIGPKLKWNKTLTLPQPFNRLTIDDMTVSDGLLDYPGGKFEGVSLHITSWQPIRNGEFVPSADLAFAFNADQAQWRGYSLQDSHIKGTKTAELLRIDQASGTLFHGTVDTQFSWDLAANTIKFDSLTLDKLQIELNLLSGWPVTQPTLQADKIQLNNVSAINLGQRFALNQIDGVMRDFSWSTSQPPVFSYSGKVGEYTNGLIELSDMSGEGKLDTQAWKMELKGSAYAGTFSADMEGDRPWHSLVINDLQLAKMQPELYPGWRERLASQPFQQIDFHHVNFNHVSLISFDDSVPLTVKWFDLFLTDLRWTPVAWQTTSDKSRMEASWLELVYQTLVTRQADIQAELTKTGFSLNHANAQVEDVPFTASGFWSLQDNQPHKLNLSLKGFDLEQLSDMLRPTYPFAGKMNLMADLQSKGTTWLDLQKNLQGSIAINGLDWFISGLNLDPYLDSLLTPKAPNTQTLAQLTGHLRGGDTGFNHVNIKLTAHDGKLATNGSAFESITHLVAVNHEFDLLKQEWHLKLGLLDEGNHPVLNATVQGKLAQPEVQFQLPNNAAEIWQTSPIHYPPQGMRGKLRP